MKVRAFIEFEVKRASEEDCNKFGQPLGSIEIIDPHGIRLAFVASVEEAKVDIAEAVGEAWGAATVEEVQ